MFDENGDEDEDEANGSKSPCRRVLQSATSSTGRHVGSRVFSLNEIDDG